MKIKNICITVLFLVMSALLCAPACASGSCECIINTQEQGNTVYVYDSKGSIVCTGTSDADGVIRIENLEEGSYKAEFKNNSYQSFSFSLPYEGSLSLMANPKKIHNIPPYTTAVTGTTVPARETTPETEKDGGSGTTKRQNTDKETETANDENKNTTRKTDKDETTERQTGIPFTGSDNKTGIIFFICLCTGTVLLALLRTPRVSKKTDISAE